MLTKSDLLSYLQCPRKLWLEKKAPDSGGAAVADSFSDRRVIDGNIVGEHARKQLGDNLIWPRSDDNPAHAAEQAKKELANNPDRPAAEVPMYFGGLYARADALLPERSGYVLCETKASTFPLKGDKITPASPEPHHLNDIAIQAWVMSNSQLPMSRAVLNLLDSRWRYPGNGDYRGLFRQYDVSSEVIEPLKHVPRWLSEADRVISGMMPDTTTGKHCNEPHDCPFLKFCKEKDPTTIDHPIDLLPDSAGKLLAKRLRETKGYLSILDPQPEELTDKQSELYRRIQEAHRTGVAIHDSASREVMNAFAYPRYYFDFEGIDLAVPIWAGVRPYEQIPFQWSCHIERSPGKFSHAEFLDLSGDDPSLACIEHLRDSIDPDDGGPIFVYYQAYERGRLEELAERHPEHSELLQKYIDRLVDLLPIVKQHFYHPIMHGSFSIKKVLPAIAPDLDYSALDGVQDGTAAQVAYIEAALNQSTSQDRKAELDQQLRSYCRQDTWAMVELAYFLGQAERPQRTAG